MTLLILTQLSKEEEASIGQEDLEVRREDQDKINRFSRLHQRETFLEEDLKTKAVGLRKNSFFSLPPRFPLLRASSCMSLRFFFFFFFLSCAYFGGGYKW
jgi:hypothetical protein